MVKPVKDAKRLRWVRGLPCALQRPECWGPVEAHHPTGAGLALRADDAKAYPLCHLHHTDRHSASGIFRTMLKAERKLWEAEMVKKYQALYAEQNGGEF